VVTTSCMVRHGLTFSREAQTWGAGRVVVSESDRKDLKKARKEGRLAEAMLDRRAALKRLVRDCACMRYTTNTQRSICQMIVTYVSYNSLHV
jgi:hypothetical protein